MKQEYTNGKPRVLRMSEIINVIGGKAYNVDTNADISKIAHIKRNIEEGCLFFAFRTWRIDTYANIYTAMARKASAIVTERFIEDYPCIVVKDSHEAFMKLSKYYRDFMDIDIVAVTGSIGKTSTKEMISCVLQEAYEIEKNDENSNSSDLAARNLLHLKNDTEILVQEVAIQNIEDTSLAIKPTVAVFTNIGYSHLETFGSRENICKEKLKLTSGLEKNGLLVINADDELLFAQVGELKKEYNICLYSLRNSNADFWADKIEKKGKGYAFEICHQGERYKAEINCQGLHNITNAVAAFAVGMHFNMQLSDILSGLEKFMPSGYRQNMLKINEITILADCFNAAPDSVEGAMDTLENIEVSNGGKRIAVLGDMLELGECSKELHERIGNYINNKKIDMVVLYGKEVNYAKNCITMDKDVRYVLKRNDLIALLKKEALQDNNVILFKGSHGMELERVIDELFGTNFAMPYFENTYVCERIKRENCDIKAYFKQKKYKTAAIYGMSVDEGTLIDMLSDAGVEVLYGIDRKAEYVPENLYPIKLVTLDEAKEKVDFVFLTLRTYEEALVQKIKAQVNADVLSYKTLVEDVLE